MRTYTSKRNKTTTLRQAWTGTHTHTRIERGSEPQGKMKRKATRRGVVGKEERNKNAYSEPCPVGQRTENKRQLRSRNTKKVAGQLARDVVG